MSRKATPVCPHCGQIERDAWEIDFGGGAEGDAEVTCGSCGEDYHVCREIDVYYTSSPLKATGSES